jgi:hypothetical protein
MPTNVPPVTHSADPAARQPAAATSPRAATRLQLPGGYYDPDAAAFDQVRPADVDALMSSTAPVAPRPALARSTS